MTDNKYIQKLLSVGKHYDIDKKSHININEICRPFEGFPRKRKADDNALLLFPDPFSDAEGKFHEFSLDTIAKIDDLGKVTNTDGETANKIRVWVKKGASAVLSQSFTVN